ncbi:MAG: hypothetical protein E6Q64_06280, partial [Ottowia sp.]
RRAPLQAALQARAEHPSALVREHVQWALGRWSHGGASVFQGVGPRPISAASCHFHSILNRSSTSAAQRRARRRARQGRLVRQPRARHLHSMGFRAVAA